LILEYQQACYAFIVFAQTSNQILIQ